MIFFAVGVDGRLDKDKAWSNVIARYAKVKKSLITIHYLSFTGAVRLSVILAQR